MIRSLVRCHELADAARAAGRIERARATVREGQRAYARDSAPVG